MNNDVKKPCNECPFRRESLPGWLGDDTPEGFMATTMADAAMPCHQTVDYDDPDWREQLEDDSASFCAGALNFFANIHKLSRDRDRPRGEKDATVFSRPSEFIEHHTNGMKKP